MQLRKADRKQAKLRIGLSAPSGAGKTYSALKLARGLADGWDKIAIIDTENGSAELYSNLGDYLVMTMDEVPEKHPITEGQFSPSRYVAAIKACEQAGVQVIIIDSVTHEWDGKGGCLEMVDAFGGKFQDWAKVTPEHRRFLDAILTSPCHIITTVRTKQEYAMEQKDGKSKVQKLGMKEIQREGFEYELTVNFTINTSHYAEASKDRTGLFEGKSPFIIDEETGKTIKNWNETGKIDPIEQKREIMRQLERIGLQTKDGNQIRADIIDVAGMELAEKNFAAIIEKLKETPTIDQQIEEGKKNQPETVELPEEKPAPQPEAAPVDDKPVGPAKISLLRSMGVKKEGLVDDQMIIEWLAVVHGIVVEKLEELTSEQATAIINQLLQQPTVVNEDAEKAAPKENE